MLNIVTEKLLIFGEIYKNKLDSKLNKCRFKFHSRYESNYRSIIG